MPDLSSVKSVSCALNFSPKLLHALLGMPQALMQRPTAHTTYLLLGDTRRLTCGTGAEPVGRLQVLDIRCVLAGDVDGGGWRGWLMKPRLTGGLCV